MGREAATAYIKAAESASFTDAIEFRRTAAEHLLRSGHIDEGVKLKSTRTGGATSSCAQIGAKPLTADDIRPIRSAKFLKLRTLPPHHTHISFRESSKPTAK